MNEHEQSIEALRVQLAYCWRGDLKEGATDHTRMALITGGPLAKTTELVEAASALARTPIVGTREQAIELLRPCIEEAQYSEGVDYWLHFAGNHYDAFVAEGARRLKDPKGDAAARALAAIDDLIVATVQGGDRGRFMQVQRLAGIGQQLEAAVGSRVADFPVAGRAMGVINALDAVPPAQGYGNQIVQDAPVGDALGLTRHLLLLAGPYVQQLAEGQRARICVDEAQELSAVSEALARAKAAVEEDERAGRGDGDVLAKWNRRERDTLAARREQLVAKLGARVTPAQSESEELDRDE